MDISNLPPNHGGPLGDIWFRGLAKPDHFLSALKEDFYILVVGCMMKYIRLERASTGLTYKARIVKAFHHGVDGVSAIAGNQFRDVYALAEKRHKPRIFLFQIHKTDRGELEPHFMHSLKRVHSWDIRTMEFVSKELLVILTGFPTFNAVLFRWSTNEELMSSQSIEPNLFSKLLVSPMNPCHWIEYGHDHMFVYEMPSLTRTDVIRTKVNLPTRNIKFDHADPLMGKKASTKLISACWTLSDEFYVLDEQLGIHMYLPNSKVLQWICTISQTFLGLNVEQIVPYGEGLAAITGDGWFLCYNVIKSGGSLEVATAYKMTSRVVRYIHFPETPTTFYAVTESKGMIEGVSHGMLRDPFAIPDLMFANIIACCFIEPQSNYMAIVTKFGKVVILECESGAPIAKWRLPFKVVGIACHPVLPFLFCGTTYGCVNVLDIRNLKSPKLINRRFFTRDANSSIEKFGFVAQGRYVISADTVNNRIFVQYGYPFMNFDFVESAKLPARISHISVPGCDKDDLRFQVYMGGKSPSDQGVVAFLISFSLRNDRLMALSSQILDQPVSAMCLSPMKKYQYCFYPLKKGLGVVPLCDDNQWINLQEPEHYVESHFRHDVTFMMFHGTKLYTFCEDGLIQVHEAPVIPKKKTQLPMVLNIVARTQTHCFSDMGIKEGIVSLDGSQVIALGQDGTFCRVRFFPKPAEPDWKTLGYTRTKLSDYQVGTYLIDQEFQKAGEEMPDRISDIKVKIDTLDPVNFYDTTEETSDEEEEDVPTETPKAETIGDKFKYGPKRSFVGTKTRKRIQRKKNEGGIGESTESQIQDGGDDSTSKKQLSDEQATEAEDVSLKDNSRKNDMSDDAKEAGKSPGTPNSNASDDDGSQPRSPSGTKVIVVGEGDTQKQSPRKSEDSPRQNDQDSPRGEDAAAAAADGVKDSPKEGLSPKELETEVVMQPKVQGASAVESTEGTAKGLTKMPVQVADSAVQKLLSKMHDTALTVAPTPLMGPETESKKKIIGKVATAAAIKSAAPSALKGILSERLRRKEIVKDKQSKSRAEDDGKEVDKTTSEQQGEDGSIPEDTQKGDVDEGAAEEGDATDKGEPEGGEGDDAGAGGGDKKKKKRLVEVTKAAKVLSLLFGKKKQKDNEGGGEVKTVLPAKSKKKIKKFQGGQASKLLSTAQNQISKKLKAPPSRTARTRLGQAKLLKYILEEDKKAKADDEKKNKRKKPLRKMQDGGHHPRPAILMKGKKKDAQSEHSRALQMEHEREKHAHVSVLHDPAIYLVPEEEVQEYDGFDVSDVLTVEHNVRRKEYTEAEFFAQYEKTLMYRQHVPKAESLRQEFKNFTELMEELMYFNKQREEGNQVDMKEFNFDDEREPRMKERAEKQKRIAHIQMTVRNKLRHAKINAMKFLVWDQFETKGMTLVCFRKKLDVSNYPLLPEREFYNGPVNEAISWRRLEQRLEVEEEDCYRAGNGNALRVLQHEMQFMTPAKKRLYMKSIMAIDPTIRFDEYEASDSDQSDEFFAKVFEELGLQLPEEATGQDAATIGHPKSDLKTVGSTKAGQVTQVAMSTSNAAKKFLNKKGKAQQQEQAEPEGYVDKLKKMLLEDQDLDDKLDLYKPVTVESSLLPSEDTLRAQSRRDFMANIKASKPYKHPTGVFGPRAAGAAYGNRGEGLTDEIEILMKPHEVGGIDAAKVREISEAVSASDAQAMYQTEGGVGGAESNPRMRMVIRQKKKMKFKRTPDVTIEDEEDLSGPEMEAVIQAEKKKFDAKDDLYKERFQTVNNIFFGSNLAELNDMYQFQPAPFRYTQFDLGSRHELWRHHYIIMSEIYQLKKFFNRQFEQLRNAKAYSLRKMADRNERIREIYYYLKVDLDILDEKWLIQEDPVQIFTVTKDEIPVERYLTAEQKRLEEQRRLEDLARRRTRMAEFRKKALIAMMDNRLEVKREEILVNDIPKPAFMLEKDPLEFTLEEYLLSLQYAEAVEKLEKSRIEMIKELEDELSRLYRANANEINTIDLRITELALMKFQFHQNVQMEESRILRAIRQLRTMEDLDREEKRITKIVSELKSTMKTGQHMASQMENKKMQCEEEIAKVAEQEKELERNFRRDLGDVGHYFEFFYKNYKKKPKISMKGLNKAEVYETMVRALRADNIRVFARENGEIGRIVVMSIYDLEDQLLMPKDCPRSYWDKFNRVRRERLACEYQTKTLMAEIDRINEAINECNKKESDGTAAIAAVLGVISHKNDLKNYFVANVEFQMVLGKGHCEINCWNFRDHMNSTIILIDNVERLNQRIFEASEKLIKEMTKTAIVHRDIKEIEWRFLVVEMATKDLKKVRHDVICFKPTKKLLEVLRKGINLDTMHTDRIALVDYLRTTYVKYQKLFVKQKKKQLNLYKNQTKRKHETNEEFKRNIFEETESLVASQVNKVTPDMGKKNKNESEKRAAQLLFRGYLNRKIIRLSNEIETLEQELEKNYQRTYPVL